MTCKYVNRRWLTGERTQVTHTIISLTKTMNRYSINQSVNSQFNRGVYINIEPKALTRVESLVTTLVF